MHGKDDDITVMNGSYINLNIGSTKPTVSAQKALQIAIDFTGNVKYIWQDSLAAKILGRAQAPEGELVVFLDAFNKPGRVWRLAWKFHLAAMNPVINEYVYVDAHAGKVINRISELCYSNATGTAQTRYSGTKDITSDSFSGGYRLREVREGVQIETLNLLQSNSFTNPVDLIDNDNSWTSVEHNNVNKQQAALDVHWAVEKAIDYWKTVHNRVGWNGVGVNVRSYVNWGTFDYAAFNGDPNNPYMYFGTGSEYSPFTTLDFCSHEFAHGIDYFTSRLNVPGESRALDEGFADIWAAMVEHWAAPEKNPWVFAEEVVGSVGSSNVRRSMISPNVYGDPDTYKGTYWGNTDDPNAPDDRHAHNNSTVISHWFYILSEGKTGGNDNPFDNCYSVTGIGINDAARILYRTQSVPYITSASQFADARSGTIQAATDLFGERSLQVAAVTNAWHAVGVGPRYNQTKITDISYLCSGGQQVSLLTYGSSGVTWSVTPAAYFEVSLGTGITTFLKPKYPSTLGKATITFKTSACGGTVTMVSKDFWIGKPRMVAELNNGQLLTYSTAYNEVCEDVSYNTEMDVSGSAFNDWQRIQAMPSTAYWNEGVQDISFYFTSPGQTSTFRLTSGNACGTFMYDFKIKSITCSGDPCGQFTVSPNPTESQIHIQAPAPCEFASVTDEQRKSRSTIRSIVLSDITGLPVFEVHFANDQDEVILPVSDVKPGIYLLRIRGNANNEIHRIEIK